MANNSNSSREGGKQLTQDEKRSGQQALGERGQKADRKNQEHYRSSEQKKQRGTHGGNR